MENVNPHKWENSFDPIRNYFAKLVEITLHPTRFFKQMPLEGGLAAPLAFALVTHWVGSAFQYLWNALVGGTMRGYFSSMFRMAGDVADIDSPGRSVQMMEARDRFLHWIWGAGSVVSDPFVTLASILFISLLVFVGARIFVSSKNAPEVTYESTVRIICYGMAPSILAILPFFGGFIGWFVVAIVTIIGVKEVYRTGGGRAIVIALFPKILFVSIFFLGIAFFAFAFIKLIAASF